MKVLLFVFMLVYLLDATNGLACRECSDVYQHHDMGGSLYTPCEETNNKTVRCSKYDYCVTYKFDTCETGDSPCYERDCDYLELCESVGTREVLHPVWMERVEVDCCQGDMCNDKEMEKLQVNVGTSVTRNKITKCILLFYVLFPMVIALLFV